MCSGLLLLLALLAASGTDALRVNGWYPCTTTARNDKTSSFFAGLEFECAKFQVPLCHDGVCESDRTTEVFVKRMLAEVRPATKTVWFLEGGPGASSAHMEVTMTILWKMLNRNANVYTMDHRGTGRSGFLQCEAAQAQADGSPAGEGLALAELADCVRDVLFEVDGHTAAYSVTSAARDVVALLVYLEDVAEYPEEETDVFVYGSSYGTYLVERIMHLAPPQVKGYILDGVLSETGFSAVEWNKNILPPTKRYFEACFDAPSCPLQFKSKHSVIHEVLAMYDEIDASVDSNTCASGLSLAMGDVMPSDALRQLFTLIVRDPTWRQLIPSLLLRVHRCSSEDFDEFMAVLPTLTKGLMAQYGDITSNEHVRPKSSDKPSFFGPTNTQSEMLYMLITFSELWQLPMPDLEALEGGYATAPFGLDAQTLSAYCVLSGGFNGDANVTTCNELRDMLEEKGVDVPTIDKPFLYAHDQYWNATATLPDSVGVLLFVGGLDFQTPSELGKREFEALASTNKMIVDFDWGAHSTGVLPTGSDDNTVCGPHIIASFVDHDGDVAKVNTGCMELLPNLVFDDHVFNELFQETEGLMDSR